MYKYTFSKKVQSRLKFYSRFCQWVTFESFKKLSQEGFPCGYEYWHVLAKCVNYVFYSKHRLQQIYVAGYPVPVKFFDIEKV